MKIKIVGFKVGVSRPTANRTVEVTYTDIHNYKPIASRAVREKLARALLAVLDKSDFISIWRVNE